MAQDPSKAQEIVKDESNKNEKDDSKPKMIRMRFKDEFQMPFIEIDSSKLDTLTGKDLWDHVCEKSEKYDKKAGNYKIMGHSVYT